MLQIWIDGKLIEGSQIRVEFNRVEGLFLDFRAGISEDGGAWASTNIYENGILINQFDLYD